jgi:hypothetical protein
MTHKLGGKFVRKIMRKCDLMKLWWGIEMQGFEKFGK